MKRKVGTCLWLLACLLCAGPARGAASVVDVPHGPLATGLVALARQSGVEVLFDPTFVRNLSSGPVHGRLTPSEALTRLLAGTGIGYRAGADGAFALFRLPVQATAVPDAAIAEVLVVGRRTQNADIARSENHIQPYKLVRRQDLALIPYKDVDELIRGRVPANAQIVAPARDVLRQPGATRSTIDLRGLGAGRTLVLVDGRRLPSLPTSQADFDQPDLNGIPLEAIERVEILTSTAGGIFGPSAIGGVVNVILNRTYRGADLTVASGLTSRGDGGHVRFEGRVGFTPDGGATDVMVLGGYAASNPLHAGDRNFATRSRQRQLTNYPAGYIAQQLTGDGIAIFGTRPLSFDAQHGGAALGASYTFLPLNFSGTDGERLSELRANAGKSLVALPPGSDGAERSLISKPTVSSALFNLRHRFSDRFELFVDGLYLDDKGAAASNSGPIAFATAADAPTNPFAQPVVFRFPGDAFRASVRRDIQVGRLAVGLIGALPGQWRASADVAVGRSVAEQRLRTPHASGAYFTALSTGRPGQDRLPALDPLGDYQALRTALTGYAADDVASTRFRNRFRDASMRAAGPLFSLPGGPLTLTVTGEARQEHVPSLAAPFLGFTLHTPVRTQTVFSAFGELRAPLVPGGGAPSPLRGLELQLAVRQDSVRTSIPEVGDVISPSNDRLMTIRHDTVVFTGGARVEPTPWLLLRGSLATGRTPPEIAALQPMQVLQARDATDPIDSQRGGQSLEQEGPFLRLFGGSARVRPEKGVTLSFGAVVNPHSGGPRVSVDVSRIEIRGQIVDFSLTPAQLMMAEEHYPDRVIRAPLTAADAARGFNIGRVVALDTGATNAGRTHVETVDLNLDWHFSTRMGELRAYASATWLPTFRSRTAADQRWVQHVGYYDGPLEWRANGGLQVRRGPLTVDLNVQYFDSYRVSYAPHDDALAEVNQTKLTYQGAARIPSQAYVDLAVRRRFMVEGAGGLRAVDLRLAVLNVFDHSPPIEAAPSEVGYSTYGDPRRRRFELLLAAEF